MTSAIIAGGVSEAACQEPVTPPAETATAPGNVTQSPILETQTSADITQMPLNTIPVGNTPTSDETVVMPTPTETPIDYSQAFNVDPQSEADFGKIIESPSPIDNPTDFDKWEDGYLAAIDAKLENYTGPFIRSDLVSGDAHESENIHIYSAVWEPIASYKYSWTATNGTSKTIIVKTYPVLDVKTGQKSSISITNTGETNIIVIMATSIYFTPTVKETMLIYYADDWVKERSQISANLLPADNGKVDPLRAFFMGRGIEPGLNKQNLVFGGLRSK